MGENVKQDINKKNIIFLVIIACVVVIVGISVFFNINKISPKKDDDKVKVAVESADIIKEKTGVNIKIEDKSSTEYFVEDKDIARVEYDARGMHFILRSSSDKKENLSNLHHTWDIPITMTSICDDGSDIHVDAAVAIEDNKIMKAEWYDNDLYYSMVTFNLVSREEFLQEVNSIIIKYHIEF